MMKRIACTGKEYYLEVLDFLKSEEGQMFLMSRGLSPQLEQKYDLQQSSLTVRSCRFDVSLSFTYRLPCYVWWVSNASSLIFNSFLSDLTNILQLRDMEADANSIIQRI